MTRNDKTVRRPIASVDLAIFALTESGLEALLTRRQAPPFAGAWSLPGGFIHVDEDRDIEAAARRTLRAKTGVEAPFLEQLQTFGGADRDPRGWSLAIAYYALLSPEQAAASAKLDAERAAWRPVSGEAVGERLAFDHGEILAAALKRLRAKVEYSSLAAHLLPEGFTLGELQSVYERVLGRRLDKSAFRKRVAEADFVEPIPGHMRRASNRPAQIYRLRRGRATTLFDRTI